jgi:3-oxoacid CoA-transferase subunit B
VIMEHTAGDGSPKLLRECTLPLTGAGVVHRVITDLCVLDATASGFAVIEFAEGVTRTVIEERTGAPVRFQADAG